jgi:hypothetical protein
MPAARFPQSQGAGDSQVTFSVTVLSPPIFYNWSWKQDTMSRLGSEEAAMNGNQGPRRARVLIVAAAVAVLATACSASDSSSTSPPTYAQELALAQCMRGHGVPGFPDPNASGGYNLTSSGSLEGDGGSVDIYSSQAQAAYGECRHLLPGGPSIAQLEQQVQQAQQRQAQALPVLLKYVQCMRTHGVPNFPGPGQSKASAESSPVNVDSPQYLTAAGACQHLLPAGAHVTISTHRSKS